MKIIETGKKYDRGIEWTAEYTHVDPSVELMLNKMGELQDTFISVLETMGGDIRFTHDNSIRREVIFVPSFHSDERYSKYLIGLAEYYFVVLKVIYKVD